MKKLIVCTAVLSFVVLSTSALADGHGKGNFFDRMDNNNDGMVSKGEFISHSKKRFDKMDGNKDGVLFQSEVDAYRKMKKKERQESKASKSSN